MSTISGIIVAIVVFCLMSSASKRFGEKLSYRLSQSIAFGVLAGLATAFSPKVPGWVAMLFLATELFMMAYIVVWWKMNGSTIPELIFVMLIDLILSPVASSSAARILAITENRLIVGTVRALPMMACIISFGLLIIDMIVWKEKLASEEFDPDDYLDGSEKLSDFKQKKLRRWGRYEDKVDFFDFSSSSSSSADC